MFTLLATCALAAGSTLAQAPPTTNPSIQPTTRPAAQAIEVVVSDEAPNAIRAALTDAVEHRSSIIEHLRKEHARVTDHVARLESARVNSAAPEPFFSNPTGDFVQSERARQQLLAKGHTALEQLQSAIADTKAGPLYLRSLTHAGLSQGHVGHVAGDIEVVQVVDETQAIAQFFVGGKKQLGASGSKMFDYDPGEQASVSVWLSGVETQGWESGALVPIAGFFDASEQKTLPLRDGGTATVVHLAAFDPTAYLNIPVAAPTTRPAGQGTQQSSEQAATP